ncbi:MAG: hypothetical protein TU36_005955 [Vulcanisaeta sp. AZ3]|jgi:hypothetical protein|nr:MAG: hypothetical protein TU36_04175 [Vulcanisaeta sp. AZ3]
MMSTRFRVLVNRRMGRVLVSGKPEDLELIREGWRVIHEDSNWRGAFEYARSYADKHDYILEWYLEEEFTMTNTSTILEVN